MPPHPLCLSLPQSLILVYQSLPLRPSLRTYTLIAYSTESLSITANQLKAMTPSCFRWFVWAEETLMVLICNWKLWWT